MVDDGDAVVECSFANCNGNHSFESILIFAACKIVLGFLIKISTKRGGGGKKIFADPLPAAEQPHNLGKRDAR